MAFDEYSDNSTVLHQTPLAISCGIMPEKESPIPPIIKTLPDILKIGNILGPDNGIIHVESTDREYLQTYRDLKHSAECVMAGLRLSGISPGDKVILQIDDSSRFLSSFWGALFGGFVPVPLPLPKGYPVPEGYDRVKGVGRILGKFCIITDQDKSDFKHELGNVDIFDVTELLACRPDSKHHAGSGDDIAFIQFSSGSTGDPKGVLLSHINLLSTIDASAFGTLCSDVNDMRPLFGYLLYLLRKRVFKSSGKSGLNKPVSILSGMLSGRNSGKLGRFVETMEILTGNRISPVIDLSFDDLRFVNWMPYSHDMGLIGFHITPVMTGMNQVKLSTRTFIENPAMFMRLIDKYRATHVPCPNFAMQWLTSQVRDEDIKGIDLSCIRALYNGSEPISASVTRAFIDKFKRYGLRRESIKMAYGMAEASLQITSTGANKAPHFFRLDREKLIAEKVAVPAVSESNCVELADLGSPVAFMKVRIVDEQDSLLRESMLGHIQVQGPNVVSGYINDAHASSGLFCGEWMRTGDMGFICDGRVVVSGRYKDIIFVNGRNVYATDIEEEIKKIPGMAFTGFAICGINDPSDHRENVVLFICSCESMEYLTKMLLRVNSLVQSAFGIGINSLVRLSELARTPSGKIKRHKLVESYLKGEYLDIVTIEGLANLTREATAVERPLTKTEAVIMKIWSEVLETKSIMLFDNFFEIGGNSIRAAKVLSRIKSEFRTDISIATIFERQTIESLALAVDRV